MTTVLEWTGPWIAFIAGAAVGSFANVCIYRIPRKKSIVSPSSGCPHCNTPIRWFDNIPIISFVLLKGRCRDCTKPIGLRYLAIELLTASLFLSLWWHTGGIILEFVLDVVFATALLIAVVIDIEHRLLPDRITIPLLGFGLAVSIIPDGLSPLESLIGMLAGGGLMYGIAVVGDALYKRDTMGGGDIKMTAAIGAFLGWKILPVALFIAFVLGAVVGVVYVLMGGKDKTIPFGPFLAAGALIALVIGQDLLSWYISLLQ